METLPVPEAKVTILSPTRVSTTCAYSCQNDCRAPDRKATSMQNYQLLVRRTLAIAVLVAAYADTVVYCADEPAQPVGFERAGIIRAWDIYQHRLTFGKGQTLALVDDGCKLSMPEWSRSDGDQPKVLVTYDSVDGDIDPQHEGRGYHGSTIGIPSSVNYGGKRGVAYNDQVAVIRALECCHCNVSDGKTVAGALQWIIDNHQEYRITTVNLAPVDDKPHATPVATDIDAKLALLRQLGIWVSAPAGNHNFTDGISWPACQPGCFAIGAVRVGKDEVLSGSPCQSRTAGPGCGHFFVKRHRLWRSDRTS